MNTHSVILTEELEKFVAAQIESGLYENVSEVVRAALAALQRDHRAFELARGEVSRVYETRGDSESRLQRSIEAACASDR